MQNDLRFKDTDVAVIGYSCRFPESSSPERFWQNLKNGRDCITREDGSDLRRTYAFGRINDAYSFDPEAFGLSELSAKLMDPQQRMMFKLCAEVLETGGYSENRKNVRVGLFCSLYEFVYVWKGYFTTSEDTAEEQSLRKTFLDGSSASRIGYHMDFTGPCVPIKASCASSLYAVHEAVNALINGECDIAIAGGVNILENQEYYMNAENTLSKNGYTKPFSADADGFVPGCGGGAVLLKMLSDSIEDHDVIHAVIKGSAINNDGSEKASYAAPSVKGECRAMSDALYIAELDADDIGYIEAHGTGTKLGDAIEITSINKVFGDRTENPLYIGSVKSNVGHLNFAAGVAGLIKTVLMLEHSTIVPSLYCEKINPELSMEKFGYKVADSCERNDDLRYAGVSAFGVGGNNCHVVLSAYKAESSGISEDRSGYGIIISSDDKQCLKKDCSELAYYLEHEPETQLRDIAYTIASRAPLKKYRVPFGAGSTESLAGMLRQPFITYEEPVGKKQQSVVWLFPGSNVLGIDEVRAVYNISPKIRECFDAVFDDVESECGIDLRKTLSEGELTDAQLNSALLPLCVQCAVGDMLKKAGVACDAVIGYSAGEYTAAYFAGVITRKELIRLYYLRNKLLAKLPEGKILTVLGDPDEFELPEGIYISARNTPNRFMITGLAEDVDSYKKVLEEKNIYCTELPLKRAGHCSIVDGIIPDFKKLLDTISFKPPKVKYISSYTGRIADTELVSADYWTEQLRSKVDFYNAAMVFDTFESMAAVEIGVGGQLSYFAKKSVKNRSGKTFISMICDDITDRGEALLYGLSTLTSVGLLDRAVPDGRRIYLPPSSFNEKNYNELEEKRDETPFIQKKQVILDGCSREMSELVSFLGKKCETEVLQYMPDETGWKDTETLYAGFADTESRMLEASDIKCVKENKNLEASLDMLCLSASVGYFKHYGLFVRKDSALSWAEIKDKLSIVEEYLPFAMLMLSFLRDNGYIAIDNTEYVQDISDSDIIRCIKSISEADTIEAVLEKVRKLEPDYIPFFELYADAAAHYPEVLEGRVLGKEILYPNGSYNKLFDMYKKIPEMNKVRLYSSIFAEMLEELAAESARPLKILEIGAGTGLVTWNAVKVTEKHNGDYWFTDIGASFIEKAKIYAAENGYTSLEFCKVDVTVDFRDQGVPDEYFDVIVSCNVIQATGDMKGALKNCFKALRKGGYLVLLQTIDGHHISEMLYGLTPEWWNYFNDPLRRYSPIMKKEHFCRTLEGAGFENIRFFEGNEKKATDAALIFAQRNAENAPMDTSMAKAVTGYEKRYISGYIGENRNADLIMPESWEKRCHIRRTDGDLPVNYKSETEKRLCGMIEGITGIKIDDTDSSIYSYDIDSLCGLMISSQIKNGFSIDFSVKDLLGCTTVKEIAEIIDERTGH